nr:FecR family protein [uncultured Dongia sp.]
MKNLPTLAIAGLLLLSGVAIAATEATPIAQVVDVVKDAFRTPAGGSEEAAAVGDKLLPDEAIRTASDSAIEISFPDGATLRLEADSDLVLDSYVFDPTALKSAAAISVPSGIARYTTGDVSVDDTGVEFSTPIATVGIRGTDIVISVGSDGATVIDVLSGKVIAKPNENGETAEAEEGQSILITEADQPPQVGSIGDFATAAGPPSSATPGDTGETDPRDPRDRAPSNGPSTDSGGGPTGPGGSDGGSGGGGSGGTGGGTGGGGTGGGGSGGPAGGTDGDGNAGHGDNAGGRDNDNPGKGGTGGNAGGNGGGNGGGKGRD